MSKLSLRQLEALVKEKYSLTKSLSKLNPDNQYQVGQPCFCPFHENHNTPAASIYDDEKGQTLYCFSERKLYSVVDVFKELMHYDIYDLGNRLWLSMSEDEQQAWLSKNGQYDISTAFDKPGSKELSKEVKRSVELFKNKKIDVEKLLDDFMSKL